MVQKNLYRLKLLIALVYVEGVTNVIENIRRGAWVAQPVEHLTLDFHSGHGPRVMGSSPTSGSTLSMEPG